MVNNIISKIGNHKNILLTGGSGFLGGKILNELLELNSTIYTLGRSTVEKAYSHVNWDATIGLPEVLNKYYNLVIHVAGQAHSIPKSKEEEKSFFDVNCQGTKNLLDGLSKLSRKPTFFIYISTMAVYGKEEGEAINEECQPNPNSSYAKSKLLAEEEVTKWCADNSCKCLVLRLPLVGGSNPPGNLGKMKKAITSGRYPRIIRNNARKSIVLAQDVARFISKVEPVTGIYNLTDGIHPTIAQIEGAIEKRVGMDIKVNIPLSILKLFAKIGDLVQLIISKKMPISTDRLKKLTSTLTFQDSKARRELGWNPSPALSFIEKHL